MLDSDILQALAVTVELTGSQLSEGAARVMAEDLYEYPKNQVMGALVRCRREVKSKLTLADIIQRLDDGRPGAEEAWAMLPRDESQTVVWTDEMRKAFSVCYRLIAEGEMVPARMAFKETYEKLVRDARADKQPVFWTPTLGHDPNGRESALLDAVRNGRLTKGLVTGLLPRTPANEVAILTALPTLRAES